MTTIGPVVVQAQAQAVQLINGLSDSTMITNTDSSNNLTVSNTTSAAGIGFNAGASLLWPANTPCYVTNPNNAPVAVDVAEGVGTTFSTVTVSSITGAVTIEAGTVNVENAPETFLLTGDIPSVPIAFTGSLSSSVVTTTPVPAAMKALIISGPQNASTGYAMVVNVRGNQSGTRYAWLGVVGNYKPLIVPIDPATDSTYTIASASTVALVLNVTKITAVAQAPKLAPPNLQVGCGSFQTYSGNTEVNLETWSAGVLLKSVSWNVMLQASVSGYQVLHIQAATTVPNDALQDIKVVSLNPGTTVEGEMNFASGGSDGALITGIGYVGNASGTVITAGSISWTFETL